MHYRRFYLIEVVNSKIPFGLQVTHSQGGPTSSYFKGQSQGNGKGKAQSFKTNDKILTFS
jgi:hypothetical protein